MSIGKYAVKNCTIISSNKYCLGKKYLGNHIQGNGLLERWTVRETVLGMYVSSHTFIVEVHFCMCISAVWWTVVNWFIHLYKHKTHNDYSSNAFSENEVVPLIFVFIKYSLVWRLGGASWTVTGWMVSPSTTSCISPWQCKESLRMKRRLSVLHHSCML